MGLCRQFSYVNVHREDHGNIQNQELLSLNREHWLLKFIFFGHLVIMLNDLREKLSREKINCCCYWLALILFFKGVIGGAVTLAIPGGNNHRACILLYPGTASS